MTRNDHRPAPPPEPTADADAPREGDAASCEVTVVNALGLHTRPATLLAKAALASGCEVRVIALESGESAQGDSILSLLSLGVPVNSRLRLEMRGPGASALLETWKGLFARGFDDGGT